MAESFRGWLTPRLLAVRPNGGHFGHFALELLMAFAEARGTGAAVLLVEPAASSNPALFELQPSGLRVIRWPGWAAAFLQPTLSVGGVRAALSSRWRRAEYAVRDVAADALRGHIAGTPMPASLRARLREAKSRLGRRTGPPRGYIRSRPTYYRRRLLRTPIPIGMPPAAAARAAALAVRLGIPTDRPLVVIHSRESGFKRGGREVQDKFAGRADGGGRDDSLRNGSIESYREAILLLQARGFAVVRLGDPSMASLPWSDVIDLSALPAQDAALQVYCLARSRFLVAGEAGPSAVALLTNTPVLTVNATDPIASYPIRPDGLMLLKRVIDRQSGRELAPRELLNEEYYEHLRDPARFQYVENAAADITRAVDEMSRRVTGVADTPGQLRFRAAATEAAIRLRDRFAYVRKWGTEDGFLGDGAIVSFAVTE